MFHRVKTQLQALQAVPWLAAAGDTALAQLVQSASMEDIDDGREVCLRGHDVGHLLVVVKGQMASSYTNAEGKRHVIGLVGPGEVTGIIPMLDEAGAVNDLYAKGSVQLVLIPRSAFQQCIQDHPALAMQVIKLLAQRSRKLYEAAMERVMVRVSVRLARALVTMSQVHGAARIVISQAEVAEVLGVTRQTINLELKRMEKAGWLRLSRGQIQNLDVKALNELAQSAA
jgi:CRP/FNR family transcriptional regulator, cyclic AMP receptor protein